MDIAPPPSLSPDEAQAIARWRDEQQAGSAVPELNRRHSCRCGAWLRRSAPGGTRCSRSEALINRFGEPVGGFVCDGQPHPGDRTLLLATICGEDSIVVGLVRKWGQAQKLWIAGCGLCGWHPSEPGDADVRALLEHMAEQHNLADEAIQAVGPDPSFTAGTKAA